MNIKQFTNKYKDEVIETIEIKVYMKEKIL